MLSDKYGMVACADGIIQPEATDAAGAFRQVSIKGVLVGIRS